MPQPVRNTGAARADFRHVGVWVFDLDNTLYPADCNLFAQIDARICTFIEARLGIGADAARKLQKQYYVDYGTTLSGLMREHGVAATDFLDFVHDIDLGPVAPNPKLVAGLAALPGRRYVFTNGSVRHAESVLDRIGAAHLFDGIFDIAAADYVPKPHHATYARFLEANGVADPRAAAMFEDLPVNLAAPYALGMTTVLVQGNASWLADEPVEKRPAAPGERHDHVHHVTDDLPGFLGAMRLTD